jgi:2-polyprenyl-3-methyl-5-hydroxy-6-metoxy-1,4-benzoquinol methylase
LAPCWYKREIGKFTVVYLQLIRYQGECDMNARLSERDEAEIERSVEEAKKVVFRPQERAQIERYVDPPASSPFPLEYAFHLLGDVRGRTVLDFGCGSGTSVIPLIKRGATVIGVDISPELIALAQKRLDAAALKATLKVGSAYESGLAGGSIDVIFCMSLIHHLDIAKVRDEMQRLLKPTGYIVLKEPIRFSKAYASLRRLLPAHADISDYEHPLTRAELSVLMEPFTVEGLRYFRLPFVPLTIRFFPALNRRAWALSDWMLQKWPATEFYATSVVMRLRPR